MLRLLKRICIAFTLAGIAALAVATPANATAPGPSSQYWKYGPTVGEIDLYPGWPSVSIVMPTHGGCNAHWVYQGDGNIVMYNNGIAVWNSHTAGQNDIFKLQGDGNAVLYHVDGTGHSDGVVLWASNTVNTLGGPSYLQIFDNRQWSINAGGLYPYVPMGYYGRIFVTAGIC